MSSFDDAVNGSPHHLLESLADGEWRSAELSPQEWRALVERATFHVTNPDSDVALLSPGVRLAALENVLAEGARSGAIDHEERAVRQINAATLLIPRYPDTSAELLDSARQFQRIFDILPVTLGEAQELSVDWRARPVAEILRLKKAKTLLKAAFALAEVLPPEEVDPRLEAWREVSTRLP